VTGWPNGADDFRAAARSVRQKRRWLAEWRFLGSAEIACSHEWALAYAINECPIVPAYDFISVTMAVDKAIASIEKSCPQPSVLRSAKSEISIGVQFC
jgi:hypothetical protein